MEEKLELMLEEKRNAENAMKAKKLELKRKGRKQAQAKKRERRHDIFSLIVFVVSMPIFYVIYNHIINNINPSIGIRNCTDFVAFLILIPCFSGVLMIVLSTLLKKKKSK